MHNLRIGILGGGQLGAMLIRQAIDFGLDISVLEKSENAPCARYTKSFIKGDPADYNDVLAFGKDLDVLTIEKEAVNVEALKVLEKKGVKVYPSPDTIGIIQNKYIQKKFLESNGIPVVKGIAILNRANLKEHADLLPFCLKKCVSGYDGKGVMIMNSIDDLDKGFDEPSVLEELVDIEQEISVIISRNHNGTIECYDPVMMIFDKERLVLDFQMCPANISKDIAIEACNIAIKIAEALSLEGILAVEMFITKSGQVLVNELAPRPHNSGHHTIEACNTSQYEQQLRVMLNLPLGDTRLNSSSVMINILEPAVHRKTSMENALRTLLGNNDVHLHWYGKEGGREGRKMGHITITERTIEYALAKAATIRHLLKTAYEEN